MRATRPSSTIWSILRKWWVCVHVEFINFRVFCVIMFFTVSLLYHLKILSSSSLQRIIANTIRQVRHCRSQPFSKYYFYHIYMPASHTSFQSHLFFFPVSPLSASDPDICQPNKNQAEVRGYVRKLCVIDNQRALTQLSYRMEPRRTWAPDLPPLSPSLWR